MPKKDGEYSRCPRPRINGEKYSVSHTVLESLGQSIKSDEVVHHINGDTSDNRVENLQVMSRSEHAKLHMPRDYSRYGVSAAEDRNLWSKYYRKEMAEIKEIPLRIYKIDKEIYNSIKFLLALGVTQRVVAETYGLNPSSVSRIKNNQRHQRFKA